MALQRKNSKSQTKGPAQRPRTGNPSRKGQVVLRQRDTPLLVQRAVVDPSRAGPADILALQRTAGNGAVSELIQAKLKVGPAGDHYEREADRVAEQVMSMPAVSPKATGSRGDSPVQRQEAEEEDLQAKPLIESITPLVQRQGEAEAFQMKPSTEGLQRQEEEQELQMKPLVQRQGDGSFEAGSEVESRLAGRKGGGSPLPDGVRAFMEPRFGADFGGVRVHTDGEAAQLTRQVSAQAFTHGQDIYVGEGRYDPGSEEGKRLLAHELTHTIQQGAVAENAAGPRRTAPQVQTIQRAWFKSTQRYNLAMAYLASKSTELAGAVRKKTKKLTDGRRISLGKLDKQTAESEITKARMAALLCLCAFGRRTELQAAKQHYDGLDQAELDDAIMSWHRSPSVSATDLRDATQRFTPAGGAAIDPYHKARRGGQDFLDMFGGNCYSGAQAVIYLAGAVSLRWFLKPESGWKGGELPKSFSFTQTISDPDEAGNIPAGKLLYFERAGSWHFAVSTAAGQAWGHNNPTNVIVDWVGESTRPTVTGGFSIGDWLRTCQSQYRRYANPEETDVKFGEESETEESETEVSKTEISDTEVKNKVFVKVASCIPTNAV